MAETLPLVSRAERSLHRQADVRLGKGDVQMPENSSDRRTAPRFSLVLTAEITELPSGTRLRGRTSDVSQKGCYVDMLNPIPAGSAVRIKLTHENEVFEAGGKVVYSSAGLGMGISFDTPLPAVQSGILNRWLGEVNANMPA
jgi:hypothetical protein